MFTAIACKVVALKLASFKRFIKRGMKGWIAYANVKELARLNDPLEHVVFIVLPTQREATFERGVTGDNVSDVV